MMLAAMCQGYEAPCELSSRHWLRVCSFLLPQVSAAGAGGIGGGACSDVEGAVQRWESCPPSWGADPMERNWGQAEVKGPSTLPSQTQHRQLQEPRTLPS